MGSFRRVDAEQAGPQALGILVPPGRRTFVILRPRSLGWDLLLCRSLADLTFRDLAHDEASAAAQGISRALRDGTTIEIVPGIDGSRVRALIGAFVLLVCPRRPGLPYAPLVCSEEEARGVVALLTPVLCPAEGSEQEVYFNVRFFERPGV